jgi:ABC-2 type transport system permease protein
VTVCVALAFGRLALGLPLDLATIRWGYLGLGLVCGLAGVLGLGYLSVAAALGFTRESWRLPEALGGAFFLVCGVIFPITVLPAPLQQVAQAVPLTWWLEAMRRAILGPTAMRALPWADDRQVLEWLAFTSVMTLLAGVGVFGWAETRARRRGMLDQQTGF